MDSVRVDKFLWSIRVYKTRSEAAEACRNGHVTVNGSASKSSRDVKQGDTIKVRKGAVHYSWLVVQPIDKRQGAKLVEQYATDITPQSELDKLAPPNEMIFLQRERGTGRPTKKERREIDRILGDN
ncbi:MAG TPA: S4 domain-containing protein [Candidatus Egerieousia sp.]|nr:S4 domain-containing protein [Candidatus Egerieousia sp.]HPT05791.1 S4 domain-containing protein [Candidatus Egerieousia sp.]